MTLVVIGDLGVIRPGLVALEALRGAEFRELPAEHAKP
jgi:hypothetical protein